MATQVYSHGATGVRLLAFALRIQQAVEYTFDDAVREFGFSLRTYRRYIQRLRAAGMVLHTEINQAAGQPFGYVRYITFDVYGSDVARSDRRGA